MSMMPDDEITMLHEALAAQEAERDALARELAEVKARADRHTSERNEALNKNAWQASRIATLERERDEALAKEPEK